MASSSPAPPDASSAAPDPVLDAILGLVSRDEVKVPPIPAVVGRLSEQLRNAEIDLRGVTKMVGTDQALSAHILRCASHTLLASRGEVTSLGEAIMRVGTNGLFSLVVSFCLARGASHASPLQSLRRDVFCKAAATAEFCRRLAAGHGADPDGAFLCGLLGSFGVTVALGAVEQVLDASRVKQGRPAGSWMAIARRCDEESATSVAAKWGMPKLVTDVLSARRSGEVDPKLSPYVVLLDRAERLTELFYREAAPSEADIVGAIECTPAEAADIAAFLPQVAASVHALGAATEDRKTRSTPIALVEAPATSLRGQVVPASIPVTVERKGGDEQIVCVGLAADGFVAHGTQPLPLNQVVKCRMLGVEEDLELVAFVAGVARNGDEYRFEMKPMGLVGGHASRWQKLRTESAREFSVNEVLDRPPVPADAAAPADDAAGLDESPESLEFGPLHTSEPTQAAPSARPAAPPDPDAAEGGEAPVMTREGGYVSMHARRNVFRRFADWINGRDVE
ncbi:MAG TPA: HDOD domain-containing protein [Kofleriaceae bacterium]|nr:HDOD domain-containing protein [Kofleriaceae bacterium]